MSNTLERLKQKLIIGIKTKTTNEDGQAQTDIPLHWEKFFDDEVLEKIPNKLSSNLFSIYTEYEGDFTKPYSYILGCEVSTLDQIPPGMVGLKIPAGPYAVFNAKGEFPSAVVQTWVAIWSSDLNRAYTSDFEIYPADFDPEGISEVKVYIALP